MGVNIKKKSSKKLKKKWWKKKLEKKNQKSLKKKWGWKKSGVKKSKSGLKIKNISYKMKKRPWYMLNMGQNILWLEAHSYKWFISIFEEVASELLFGLVLKCTWNGTEFFLILFTIFNRVVFPYDFWQKKSYFTILLGISWYVFKLLLSDF